MSNTYEKIKEDFLFARKNKLNDIKNTLSLVIDNLQKQEKSLQRELEESEVIKNIESFNKKLYEELKYAKKTKNDSLIKKVQFEISIVEKYIPKKLNEQETRRIITDYIYTHNIPSIKQMGQVMGYINKNYGTVINMKLASNIVKDVLQ